MAIYHLHVKSISRGTGRSATGAAAYRAGERIRDERTGVLHNHASRRDVSYKEIILPQRLNTEEMGWARDRAALWNRAEQAEARRDARVAREYEVALPAELTAAQRVQLARAFAGELADWHGVAIDLTVHDPRPAGDPRNYHAHLLSTTRQVSAVGFGAKTGLDMSSSTRQRLGLTPAIVEFNGIRERWAELTNEALRAAGLEASVDHRSYQARGVDREPRPHIPYASLQSERHGVRSEIAEQLRERYRLRVHERQLRQERQAEPHRQAPSPAPPQLAVQSYLPGPSQLAAQPQQLERQPQLLERQQRFQSPAAQSQAAASNTQSQSAAAAPASAPIPAPAPAGQNLEELRRQARQAWLQLRASASRSNEQVPTHSVELDHELP